MLDYGNTVLNYSRYRPELNTDTQKSHGAVILDILSTLKYNALNVGEAELLLGKDFLKRQASRITLISSNLVDKKSLKPVFEPFKIFKRRGFRFLITGAFPKSYSPRFNKLITKGNIIVEEPATRINEILAKEKGNYDFAIVLSALRSPANKSLAKKLKGANLILGARSYGFRQTRPGLTQIPIIGTMPRGSNISIIILTISDINRGFVDISRRAEIKKALDRTNAEISRIQKLPYARATKRKIKARLIEKRSVLERDLQATDKLSGNKEGNTVETLSLPLDDSIKDDPQARSKLKTFHRKSK